MKIFFDTNIVLDILDPRRPSGRESTIILNEALSHSLEIVVTTQSIVDCCYIALRTGILKSEVDVLVSWLSDHVNIRPITVSDIKEALRSGAPDFEDAAQLSCADSEGCDVFLTGDTRLLSYGTGSSMLMLTPQQFVDKMRRQ